MFRSFFCTLAIGAADDVYFVPHIRCWNIHLHLSRFPYQKNLSEYSKRFLPVERTSISCLNGNFKYYHLSYILVLCPLIISSIVSMKKVKEKSEWLFGMSGRQTVTTVIDGKVRMQDRELVDIDEKKILAEARAHAQAMWNRINSR